MNGKEHRLNPYFIGLPILIAFDLKGKENDAFGSQSLFYWITYSYNIKQFHENTEYLSQSLFYWITYSYRGLYI